MKKTYIIPTVTTVVISAASSVLLTTSETTVSGQKGGWTKDEGDWDEVWDE